MSNSKSARIKGIVLLIFISVSLVLVLMITSNNLIEQEFQDPGFYRPTISVDESIYLTLTAGQTRESSSGHRGTGEHATPSTTPNPQISPMPSPTEGPDQDN